MIITGSLIISKSVAETALSITGSAYFTGSSFIASASTAYMGNALGNISITNNAINFKANTLDFGGVTSFSISADNLTGIVPLSKGGTGVNGTDAADPDKMTTGYLVYKASDSELQTFNTDGILYNKTSVGVQASSITTGYVIRSSNGAPAISIIRDDGTNIGIGGAIDASYKAKVHGNLGVTGTIYETSTIKIKENIQTLTDELSKILQTRPIEFDYIESKEHSYGFIAEELNEVYPDAVFKDVNNEPIGVAYPDLTSPIIRAIQQLAEKLDDLTRRIELLENK